jgi:hypothetical protein
LLVQAALRQPYQVVRLVTMEAILLFLYYQLLLLVVAAALAAAIFLLQVLADLAGQVAGAAAVALAAQVDLEHPAKVSQAELANQEAHSKALAAVAQVLLDLMAQGLVQEMAALGLRHL